MGSLDDVNHPERSLAPSESPPPSLTERKLRLELDRAHLELRRDEAAIVEELERAAFRRKHPYQAALADVFRPRSWAHAATLMTALSPLVIGGIGFVDDTLDRRRSEHEAKRSREETELAAQLAREDKLLLLAIDSTSSPERRVSVCRYIQATTTSEAMKAWARAEAESIVGVVKHETALASAAVLENKRTKDEVVAPIQAFADAPASDDAEETDVDRERYAHTVKVYEQWRREEVNALATVASKQRKVNQLELGLEADPGGVMAPALELIRDPKRCLVVFLPPEEATRPTKVSLADRVRACKAAMAAEGWTPESLPGRTLGWDSSVGGERISCLCNLEDR